MTKTFAIALPLSAVLLWAVPAAAQETPAGPAAERIKQVIVYGNDPCPVSSADEIVVCARQDESERYRIPEELRRGEPGTTKNEAWTNRVKSIEYVGRSGTQSCSPVGGGGFTGCFEQIARNAKAERKQLGSASWADLVAAERAKRLSTIDEDSEEIEARVKAEEEARRKAEEEEAANAAEEAANAMEASEE
ncbi:MAG: hypothetical protein R3E11_12745 [Sphingobium sp.]|nr:hypothetical protein [Sphingobium sp.]MCP5399265.1 hypothetical protein [Sphingomonas sp.]